MSGIRGSMGFKKSGNTWNTRNTQNTEYMEVGVTPDFFFTSY